jgi:hypothetical protein
MYTRLEFQFPSLKVIVAILTIILAGHHTAVLEIGVRNYMDKDHCDPVSQ